jgi:MFS family permease
MANYTTDKVDGAVSQSDERVHVEQADTAAAPAPVTLESFAHLNEKAILRKVHPYPPIMRFIANVNLEQMDIRLIPVLALLYLLSFLDRKPAPSSNAPRPAQTNRHAPTGGNIGNAKIEGLQEDLDLTDDQYNWCLTAFFFTYAAFEVPSNLMLKRVRPSVWLPSIMVAWGVVMTLMGIVHNYAGLLAARIFLGVTEAGLFPGVAYYLTNWYKREEIQLRQAMFFSAASVAGAFSGLLAFAIGKMDGIAGLHGWQWIFVLEGKSGFWKSC